MDPSKQGVYVDHQETVIRVPKPRLLSASKVDITPAQDTESAQNSENGTDSSTAQEVLQFSLPATVLDTTSSSEESSSGADLSSPVVQESWTSSKESSESATTSKTTPVEKHVTTIYTQRISGRSSRSSDSGSDVSSPTSPSNDAANIPVFGSRDGQSPTEVCSVQFNVAAGVTSTTTTAFAKVFTKTVETEEDLDSQEDEQESRERHLSECSFTVGGNGGGETSFMEQESGNGQVSEALSSTMTQWFNRHDSLSKPNSGNYTESFTTSTKAEEEKDVSDYCPGLAIRTLTLEDLRDKKTSPEREFPTTESNFFSQYASDMSTKSVFAGSPPSTSASQPGFFSAYASQIGESMAAPGDSSPASFSSSEFSSSEKLASESLTSVTPSTSSSSSLTTSGQVIMQCTEDAAAATLRKPFFNPIEVERKFTITEDTEDRLRSLGARLHKEKTFTDVYYDNDDYALIITDCWLRRRNDSWEAKVPLASQDKNALFAPASQYTEISSEKEISAWLVDRLGLEAWMRGDPIDLLVQAAGLTEFARFTTTRRSYTLPSCVVDLDLTDHGFKVGEIEVMAASPEEVPQAVQTISGVAQQLGLSPLTLL